MVILNAILALTAVGAVASIINLFDKKITNTNIIPMKKELPGNLPIISLLSNEKVLNFIIDSGSNISHLCIDYLQGIDIETENGNILVEGLGNKPSMGNLIGNLKLRDPLGAKYEVDVLVSDSLASTAKSIEEKTGVQIHGLLGTDFLQKYGCVVNFNSLKVLCK